MLNSTFPWFYCFPFTGGDSWTGKTTITGARTKWQIDSEQSQRWSTWIKCEIKKVKKRWIKKRGKVKNIWKSWNENDKQVTRVSEEEKLSVVSQFLQILSGSQAHKQVKKTHEQVELLTCNTFSLTPIFLTVLQSWYLSNCWSERLKSGENRCGINWRQAPKFIWFQFVPPAARQAGGTNWSVYNAPKFTFSQATCSHSSVIILS